MQRKYKLKLYVCRRPYMRDNNLIYLFEMGTSILKTIFDEERIDHSVRNVTLYFPERYMNIVEERSLFRRLEHFCPNLETVEIMTQSVYLIQMCAREEILILQSPDELENGITQESITGRLWCENAHGYDFSKLNVL